MNPFIEIQHLSKSFGDLVLLDDISFSIAEGQHIGIIAKNGNTTVSYVTSDNNEGHSTRCVYDTWYWGDERLPNPDVFTWGDMPR